MLGQASWGWANWLPVPGVILILVIVIVLRRAVTRRSLTGRLAKVLIFAGVTMGLKSPLADGLDATGVEALQVLLTYIAGLTLTREAALATAEMNGPVCGFTRRSNVIYLTAVLVMVTVFVATPSREGFTQLDAATARPAALTFIMAFYLPHGIFSLLASMRLARTLRTPAPMRTRGRNTALGWLLVGTASLNYDVLVHYIAIAAVVAGHDQSWVVRQFSLVQAPSGAIGPLAAAIAGVYWLALPARLRLWWLTPGWRWLTAAAPLIVLSPPPLRPDVLAFRRQVEIAEAMDMVAVYVTAAERRALGQLATATAPFPATRSVVQGWHALLIIALGRRRALAGGQPQVRLAPSLAVTTGAFRLGLLLQYRARAEGRLLQERDRLPPSRRHQAAPELKLSSSSTRLSYRYTKDPPSSTVESW